MLCAGRRAEGGQARLAHSFGAEAPLLADRARRQWRLRARRLQAGPKAGALPAPAEITAARAPAVSLPMCDAVPDTARHEPRSRGSFLLAKGPSRQRWVASARGNEPRIHLVFEHEPNAPACRLKSEGIRAELREPRLAGRTLLDAQYFSRSLCPDCVLLLLADGRLEVRRMWSASGGAAFPTGTLASPGRRGLPPMRRSLPALFDVCA